MSVTSPPALGNSFRIPRHPWEIPLLIMAVIISFSTIVVCIVLAIISFHAAPNRLSLEDGKVVEHAPSVLERLGTTAPFLFVLFTPLLILFGRGVLWGMQRARAIEITPTQFPEAYHMVVTAARAYNLARIPEAYVVSGSGVINAFASGHGFRRYVCVHSDLLEVGGNSRDPDALAFVIGHEVGHISAGHTSYLRTVILQFAQYFPPLQMALSRSQEYTADNHGYTVRPQGALGTMRLLAGGKYLNHQVDIDAFTNRAAQDRGFFVWLANFLASHPIGPWRSWALRDRSRSGRIFFAPKANAGSPPPPSPRPSTPPSGTIPAVPYGFSGYPASSYPASSWSPPAANPAVGPASSAVETGPPRHSATPGYVDPQTGSQNPGPSYWSAPGNQPPPT